MTCHRRRGYENAEIRIPKEGKKPKTRKKEREGKEEKEREGYRN
jgi:hypothetical protein